MNVELSMPVPQSTSVLHVLERALRDPAMPIERAREIWAFQREIAADLARVAYAVDFAQLQGELPEVPRRGRIDIGKGNRPYFYGLWEDANELIKPVLNRHGFGLSFRIDDMADLSRVTVTAVLLHRGGHSEQTSKTLPLDASGSKNAVQAHGSAVSYGKRQTAGALLNLIYRGEDDDGVATGNGKLDEAQIEELRLAIVDAGADIQRFYTVYGIKQLQELPASKFAEALAKLATFKRRQEEAKDATAD